MDEPAAPAAEATEAAQANRANRANRAARPPSLKSRALRLLAAREHSRLELAAKLQPHEAEPGELQRVLDELQAKGFINEQRVLESVIHRRAPRLGTARVLQELQRKGLDADAIAQARASLNTTETDRAMAVWQRRFGQAPATASEQARHMRFLAARGFSGAAVAMVMRRVMGSAGGDEMSPEMRESIRAAMAEPLADSTKEIDW